MTSHSQAGRFCNQPNPFDYPIPPKVKILPNTYIASYKTGMRQVMFRYALKRVLKSYRLFIALTLGVLVATTFFASTNVAADILARNALDSSLEGVVYEYVINSSPSNWTMDTLDEIEAELAQIPGITDYTKMTAFQYDYNNSEDNRFQFFGVQWDSL